MSPDRSRRSALRLGGLLATAGFAGCLSSSGDESTERPSEGSPSDESPSDGSTPTATATDSPTPSGPLAVGETLSVPAGEITVRSVDVRAFLSVLRASAHFGVRGEADAQFLVADAAVEGVESPARALRNGLELELEDGRYDALSSALARNMEREGVASVAFAVPTGIDATEGELRWTDESGDVRGSWTVPGTAVDALRSPPEFAVESFAVPETAAAGSTIEATLEVRNDGERDGTFLAELGSTRLSDRPEVRIDVPAGRSVSRAESLAVTPGLEAGSEETFVLDWGIDALERTVSIEG